MSALPDVIQGDPHVQAHNDERHTINALSVAADAEVLKQAKRKRYVPNKSYTGPVSTDNPTLSLGVASGAAYNKLYTVSANTIPADWPVECFGVMSCVSNIWSSKTSNNSIATVSTYRVMCDADRIQLFTYAAGFVIDLFIDGQPFNANPITPVATTGFGLFGYQQFVFGSAKTRLLEFRMIGGVASIATPKPYRIWKPPRDSNPTVAVVGDSYVAPTVMDDTVVGQTAGDKYLQGIYQRMAAELGITSMTSDGIGGTGYINPGGGAAPYSAAGRVAWLNTLNPDVIIMHGGGVNDLFGGNTVADTVTAVVARFTALRAAFPTAKLVFVEGFSPPGFTPATYNPNFIAIRQQAQAALIAAGIDVYYIDVATTLPAIDGAGYVTAPAGAGGNSDIYIGSDTYHPTQKGNKYIRDYLKNKIAKVLADNGTLVNTLIY